MPNLRKCENQSINFFAWTLSHTPSPACAGRGCAFRMQFFDKICDYVNLTYQLKKGGLSMKVKAIYRDPKTSPFKHRPTVPVIRAEFSDGTEWEKIEKFAKEATPKGLEFVKVVKEE